MTRETLDGTFIEQQREKLLQSRGQLQETISSLEQEALSLRSRSSRPHDETNEVFDTTQTEIDEQQRSMEASRLGEVDRALSKMDNGSYGYCEASGEPIDRARLEAQPAAQYSLAEEERLEKQAERTGN